MTKMLALLRSFPTLADLEGDDGGWGDVLPDGWDAVKFDAWAARSPGMTGASRLAAQFVLAVWSGRAVHAYLPTVLIGDRVQDDGPKWDCPWTIGGFDVMHGLKLWDQEHRDAFLAFVQDPFWP
jgi:hypothetical protein